MRITQGPLCFFILGLVVFGPTPASSAAPVPSYSGICQFLLHSKQSLSDAYLPIYEGLEGRPRTGWIDRGIPKEIAETVLEHTRKVRKAALLYAKTHPEMNASKMEAMALVHDLAEYFCPDYTPFSVLTLDEKHCQEKGVFQELAGRLGVEFQIALELWEEFEKGITLEARVLRDLDRMDAAVQAIVYERQGYEKVRDFHPYVLERLKFPELRAVLQTLHKAEFKDRDPYALYFRLLSLQSP